MDILGSLRRKYDEIGRGVRQGGIGPQMIPHEVAPNYSRAEMLEASGKPDAAFMAALERRYADTFAAGANPLQRASSMADVAEKPPMSQVGITPIKNENQWFGFDPIHGMGKFADEYAFRRMMENRGAQDYNAEYIRAMIRSGQMPNPANTKSLMRGDL